MSAKRPRPAIPVLVHVDNPTEAGSVTVDTSTIEEKMDTVITNQNRIYDKIPTSTGGGSADLTTVNEKTTALAEAIGPANSTTTNGNLLGAVKNLVGTVGNYNSTASPNGTTIRSLLYNVREGIGGAANTPTATGTTVRDLLTAIKTATGKTNSTAADNDLLGGVKNLIGSIGSSNGGLFLKDKTIRALLYNIREGIGDFDTALNTRGNTVRALLYNTRDAIGNSYDTPTATGTTVRDLLTAIKENTASGGSGGSADLTTVNEKTTALAAAIGSASDDSTTVSVIGLLKSITDKY